MTNPQSPTQTQQDVTHITEEIYKKNLELALNNRTLSVLRKIDELILSAVTDPKQIAQAVADLIIKEEIATTVGIVLLDKEKKYLQLLATEKAETELHFSELMPNTTILLTDTQNNLVQSILQKKMISIERNKDTKNETTFIYPLIVKNEPIGSLWVNIQNAERTKYHYQIDLMERLSNLVGIAINDALLYLDIQEANNSLKQLDQLKDEFVALASHELRNPMVSIKLYLWELLQQTKDVGSLTDKQKEFVQYSYDATMRLLRLVTDMLDISKIESGKLTLQIQPTSIDQLVTHALSEILPAAKKQNIIISYEKTSVSEQQVLADSEKTIEVIINLLSNAIKFSSPQGRIDLLLSEDEKMITVSVRDYGRGIPPDSISKLFQKYSRLHTAANEKIIEGTGLGLYLSKRIVELEQGSIQAQSEGTNKGAVFSFTLPKVT